MTQHKAAAIAHTTLYASRTARHRWKIALSLKHAELEPGDAIEIEGQRWRINARERA